MSNIRLTKKSSLNAPLAKQRLNSSKFMLCLFSPRFSWKTCLTRFSYSWLSFNPWFMVICMMKSINSVISREPLELKMPISFEVRTLLSEKTLKKDSEVTGLSWQMR